MHMIILLELSSVLNTLKKNFKIVNFVPPQVFLQQVPCNASVNTEQPELRGSGAGVSCWVAEARLGW